MLLFLLFVLLLVVFLCLFLACLRTKLSAAIPLMCLANENGLEREHCHAGAARRYWVVRACDACKAIKSVLMSIIYGPVSWLSLIIMCEQLGKLSRAIARVNSPLGPILVRRMVIDVWPINLDAAPLLPLHSHRCQLQKKRERKRVWERDSKWASAISMQPCYAAGGEVNWEIVRESRMSIKSL